MRHYKDHKKHIFVFGQYTIKHIVLTETELQELKDYLTEPGKMIDNRVMLQRAYGWIKMHYPNVDTLDLQIEVIASYMAKFAQEQYKQSHDKMPEL